MNEMYEPSNPLSMPFECFTYGYPENPFPVRAHRHYFAQLVVIRHGRVLMTFPEGEIEMSAGMACFISPHRVHAIDLCDRQPVRYDVIKLDVNQFTKSSSYCPPMNEMVMDAFRQNMQTLFSAGEAERIQLQESVSRCVRLMKEHSWGYDLEIRSELYILLTRMLRTWMQNGFEVRQHAYGSSIIGEMDTVTNYIENSLRESIRVEQVAQYCGMSYNAFARRFKQLYGISCKEYIQKVRLARVEHYLSFTDWDLNYISQETGFTDCSHMIREFRRLKGMTPGKYRMKHRSA